MSNEKYAPDTDPDSDFTELLELIREAAVKMNLRGAASVFSRLADGTGDAGVVESTRDVLAATFLFEAHKAVEASVRTGDTVVPLCVDGIRQAFKKAAETFDKATKAVVISPAGVRIIRRKATKKGE